MKPSGPWWPLRIGLFVLAAIVSLTGIALFFTSTLLGLPSVQSALVRQLSQAIEGHIAWDAMEVRVLPNPRFVLSGVTIDVPGHASARIEETQVRLRLFSLLRGRVEMASLELTHPSVQIDLAPDQGQPVPDPLAAYRSWAQPLLLAVRRAAPDAVLEVSDAEVALHALSMPDLQLRQLSLHAQTGANGVDLEATMESNVWKKLHLVARVEFADLSGRMSVELADASPQAWLDRALSGAAMGIDIARANLTAQVRTDGRTSIEFDARLDIASMQIAREGHLLRLSDASVRGTALLRAQDGEIDLKELRVGSLVPAGVGTLRWSGDAGNPQASLDIPRLDVRTWRDAVLSIFAGDRTVDRYASRILAGVLTNVQLRAEAQSWPELLSIDHLAATAMLVDGSFLPRGGERVAIALAGRIGLSDAKLGLSDATARLERSELTDANLLVSLRDGSVSGHMAFDVGLVPALAIARDLLPHEEPDPWNIIESAAGSLRGRLRLATKSSKDWNADVEFARSDALLRVRPLPWPVLLQAGHASFFPDHTRISGLDGAVGSSSFSGVGAVLAFESGARITGGSGRASLALAEIDPWIRSYGKAAQLLRNIDSIAGSALITVNDLSGDLGAPSTWVYDLVVQPEQVLVAAKQLPAALHIDGGSARIDPNTIQLDRVAVAESDARGLLSGVINDVRGDHLQVTASLADAVAGDDFAHWIWQRAGVPEEVEPKTPVQFAVDRLIWNPGDGIVDAQGHATFEAGPTLTADVRYEPRLLDVRSVHITDRLSDATLGLRLEGTVVQASFSGSLFAPSIQAMQKHAGEFGGQTMGNLRVIFDREHPGRSTGEGELKVQAFDLEGLLHQPVRLERLDFSANGSSLQIREAVVQWAAQVATFRGEVRRGTDGLIVNGELDSPGVVVDALLPQHEAGGPQPAATQAMPDEAHVATFFSGLWPLPVTGQIRLRTEFVDFGRYRLAPMAAVLVLEQEQVQLRLHDTDLCGLSLPLTVVAQPAGYTASMQIRAKDQHLTHAATCLSNERLFISGTFDGEADVRTNGTTLVEGVKNLEGNVQFVARDGQIRKFALLGNILAMTDVIGAFQHPLSQLGAEGFAYRTLTIDAHFGEGRIFVDDSNLDSSAFGLAAIGSVGLLDRDSQLTVLVAPFSKFDNLLRKLPYIGELAGGLFTTVPTEVTGDILDPSVVPLAPRAIASGVYGLLTRLLAVPGKPLSPFPSKAGPKPLPAEP